MRSLDRHRAMPVLFVALAATAVWVSCSRPDVSAAPTTSAASATASTPETTPAAAPAPQRSGPRTRALLIGVTTFLDPAMTKHNLRGPEHDVALFKEVLERAPFNVADADVTVLAGLPADASKQPTRANIEREFERLRELSRTGDQVVVLMAGHGSQQPANDDPKDSEPDGFDEIFLPADASGWDQQRHAVRNAVVDDDVRKWVTDIRNTGAFVWLIVDACQSGTMSRGAPETLRQLSMDELGVPVEERTRAEQTASRSRGKGGDVSGGLADDAGDIAALYAANMTETTPELPMPARTSPVHGLFTYTLANILAQSSTAMTYRELGQRVLERYRALTRYAPTPMLEGAGLDREVLGLRTWPDRPQMIVSRETSRARWRVDAGSIQGLTAGSILELFGPAGSAGADKPIGMLKVTSVEATNATVEPTAYAGVAAVAAERIVEGSRARVKAYSFGDLTLTVAVQQPGSDGVYRAVAKGRGPAAIERALADLETASNGLARRGSDDSSDWFVRVSGDRVRLVPAAGWQPTSAHVDAKGRVESPEQFNVAAVGDAEIGAKLVDMIRQIARASNLMRMASESHASGTPLVELSATRFASAEATKGVPLVLSRGVMLKVGEQVVLSMKNIGKKPIDVTLLYVDAQLGIQPLFPASGQEGDNTIQPGQTESTARLKVVPDTLGWESTIAIAVPSTGTHQNFTMLAQPSLQRTRGASMDSSPLSRLLNDAAFGTETGTRGLQPQAVNSFSMALATWRVDEVKK